MPHFQLTCQLIYLNIYFSSIRNLETWTQLVNYKPWFKKLNTMNSWDITSNHHYWKLSFQANIINGKGVLATERYIQSDTLYSPCWFFRNSRSYILKTSSSKSNKMIIYFWVEKLENNLSITWFRNSTQTE